MPVCSYFFLPHEVEVSTETKRINQKTKRKDEPGINVNLITKLIPDADYL
jgi:hypothetical protein